MNAWHYRCVCRECGYHERNEFTLCRQCGVSNYHGNMRAMKLVGRQWYWKRDAEEIPHGEKLSVIQGLDVGAIFIGFCVIVLIILGLIL
jgi:uncharacterized membrane protein YvbJ